MNTRGKLSIGPLSPRGEGAHYLPPRADFTPPVTFCNATVPSSSPYTGQAWNLRPGAEDHKRWPSRGTGC